MTKKLVAFLCFASVVVMLLGCSVSDTRYGEETDWDSILEPTPLTMRTEFDQYSVDIDRIRLVWENPTEEMLWLGEHYILEKYINSIWRRVIMYDDMFIMSATGVPSKGELTDPIIFSRRFNFELEPGIYRIISNNVISNTFTLTN